MGERRADLSLPLLAAAVGAWWCAAVRACAQAQDDVQLHETMGVCSLGLALGPSLWALRRSEPEGHGSRRATTVAAVALLAGAACWLRVASGLDASAAATCAAALLLALPLGCAGYALSQATGGEAKRAGVAVGSGGVGVGAGLVALDTLDAGQVLATSCLVAALAALLATRHPKARRGDVAWLASGLAFALALAAALAGPLWKIPEEPPPLGQLGLARARLAERGTSMKLAREASDAFSQVRAFGLQGRGAGGFALAQDSAVLASLLRAQASTATALAASCLEGLLAEPYARPRPRVLLAGLGGGLELQCALLHGASAVDVAEPSAALQEVVREVLGPSPSGAPTRAQVRYRTASARSVARASRDYDLVLIAQNHPKHTLPASGLPLPEALLLTDRGLADLISALKPTGVLSATVSSEPSALRLAATALSALRLLNVSKPETHIVVQQRSDAYGLLLQREPLTLDQVLALHARSRAPQPERASTELLDLLEQAQGPTELRYTPGAGFQNRFGELFARASGSDAGAHASYVFDIDAATDERPLFFELTRCDRADTFGALSACAALPRLAALAIGIVIGLLVLLAVRAPSIGFAITAPSCLGAASGFAFAHVRHVLSIFTARPEHAFAIAAVGLALGMAMALTRGAERSRRSPRPALVSSAGALAALALVAAGLLPALSAVSRAGAWPSVLLGLGVIAALGFALGTHGRVLLERSEGKRDMNGAFALGATPTLPCTSALVMYADYNAVPFVAAVLLAMAVLAALRRAPT